MFKKPENHQGVKPFFIGIGIFLGLMLGVAVGSPIIGLIIGILGGLKLSNKFSQKEKTQENPSESGFKTIFKKTSRSKRVFGINKTRFPKFTFGTAVWILIIFGFIWFFRPWFHGLVMGLYKNPLLIAMVLFGVLSVFAFSGKQKEAGSLFVVLAVLCFIGLSFSDVLVGIHVVNSIEYSKITEFPNSGKIRILPRVVAARYMEDSLQKSREKIGSLDFVYLNNTAVWTAPRVPEGTILYFTQPVKGIMLADALSSERKTKLISQDLSVGEGIGITDNIYWRLYKEEFFMDMGDIYYVNENGGIVTIVPIIKYKFMFPVMVPYYSGIFIVYSDGTTERKIPEETEQISYLQGNRAFPESLARLYVDSYKYHLGVLNTWFFHKDQIEISDVYGQGNRQPFILPTDYGLKWVIATEPYGESYGVFKIFFVDALNGDIEMLELDEEQTLTGPVKVISYVKQKFPRIDWSTATVVEPRPFIRLNTLYWMLSITPHDYAGISYTIFVNSENNEVTAFDNDNDVFAFAEGKDVKGVSETESSTATPPQSKESTVISEDKQSQISEKIAAIERSLEELKSLVAE